MVPVGDGTYKIVNALSLLDMEVYEASLSHSELIDQRGDASGAANEHWTLMPAN